METCLILSVGGLPPLSAKGCVQELMPLPQKTSRRTLNGNLISFDQPQRYRSIVTSQDQVPLASEGLWPGQCLKMGCIQRLWQKVHGEKMLLERDPLEASLVALDCEKKIVPILERSGRSVKLGPLTKETFVSYRPWLDVCVISFTLFTDHNSLKAGWRLEVEET